MGRKGSGQGCSVGMHAVAAGVGTERVYVTMDIGESREADEEFRKKFAVEYETFDRKCEALTIGETHLSEF